MSHVITMSVIIKAKESCFHSHGFVDLCLTVYFFDIMSSENGNNIIISLVNSLPFCVEVSYSTSRMFR